VARPPELLTEEQWALAHAASKARADEHTLCAICRDDFRADDQVLLSCSHVFHGRGLHWFTSQLNLSALYGIGGVRKGCVARFDGVLWGVQGV
jgi:hypothetical protein